jgi:hypothetical protein
LIKSYDGRGDPVNHIKNFQTHPSLYNLPDEVACQVFPLTLEGKAREWFNGLSPSTSFNTIKHQFLNKFSTPPRKKQHRTSLLALKQGRTESLTNFVRRFNSELQLIDNPSDQIILSAMINGMKPKEPLLAELACQSTACTLQQFTDRVELYLRKEEAVKRFGKMANPSHSPDKVWPEEESSSRKRKETICFKELDQTLNQKQTLLNASLSAVFKVARKDPDIKSPPKMRTPPTKRSSQKYYEYHCNHGHRTDECLSLKKEIEMFIQQGKLKEFVVGDKDIGSYPGTRGKAEPRTMLITLEILKGFGLGKQFSD